MAFRLNDILPFKLETPVLNTSWMYLISPFHRCRSLCAPCIQSLWCKQKWSYQLQGKYYTAIVYREIQGYYREIGLQGSLIHRDNLGMRLAAIVIVGKEVIVKGILLSLQSAYIICNYYREILQIQKTVNKIFKFKSLKIISCNICRNYK